MTYTITESLVAPKLTDAIHKALARHAIATIGFDGFSNDPIVFEINNGGLNLGVCVARIFWGNLHVKQLVVQEEYRVQGIGKQLMEHALEFGKKQGCKFALVETMSFQAHQFYQKLGFEVEFKRDGFVEGVSMYYLRKEL